MPRPLQPRDSCGDGAQLGREHADADAEADVDLDVGDDVDSDGWVDVDEGRRSGTVCGYDEGLGRCVGFIG